MTIRLRPAEAVAAGHPDRLADSIADALVARAAGGIGRSLSGVEVAVHRDRVFVTGTIGDAALGCRLRLQPERFENLAADHRAHLLQRYLLPEPRHALARVLQAQASAAMDVSDGLAGDCAKLCRASGVSAMIDVAHVPLSAAAHTLCGTGTDMLELALSGGDDYEILFTVAPDRCSTLMAEARAANVAVSEIGSIVAGYALPHFVHEGDVMSFATTSFSHF